MATLISCTALEFSRALTASLAPLMWRIFCHLLCPAYRLCSSSVHAGVSEMILVDETDKVRTTICPLAAAQVLVTRHKFKQALRLDAISVNLQNDCDLEESSAEV